MALKQFIALSLDGKKSVKRKQVTISGIQQLGARITPATYSGRERKRTQKPSCPAYFSGAGTRQVVCEWTCRSGLHYVLMALEVG